MLPFLAFILRSAKMSSLPKVGIISYETGNILSIANSLSRIGCKYEIIAGPKDLRACDAFIMPGVGHFQKASQSLSESGMADWVADRSRSGLLLLGICLGFQLLTSSSEESPNRPGIGLFATKTVQLNPADTSSFKVPHIGWNSVSLASIQAFNHSIYDGIDTQRMTFYFANKFGVLPLDPSTCSQSFYSHDKLWVASARVGNIFGVQFHPEKSGASGLAVLRNFLLHA